MPSKAHPLCVEIVRVAQAMRREGLVVGSLGNVSAREGEHVFITPSGLNYETMTAQDIVPLNLDGKPAAGAGKPSSERRVHLAIYRARPDVLAVVHTHSIHATAWSFFNQPLDMGTEELELFAGGTVYIARYAPSGTEELAHHAVQALAQRQAVLLARHGVVGVGKTLEAALDVCLIVERHAQMAWLLRR